MLVLPSDESLGYYRLSLRDNKMFILNHLPPYFGANEAVP